jgi:hypothetical protein
MAVPPLAIQSNSREDDGISTIPLSALLFHLNHYLVALPQRQMLFPYSLLEDDGIVSIGDESLDTGG